MRSSIRQRQRPIANATDSTSPLHSTESLRLDTLPSDLLTRLFDDLASLRHSEKATLCLISQRLLPFARHILYRDVSITNTTVMDAPLAAAGGHVPTERSVLFLRTLLSSDLPEQRLGTIRLDLSEGQLSPSWGGMSLLAIERLQERRGPQIDTLHCLCPEGWFATSSIMPLLGSCTMFALKLRVKGGGRGDPSGVGWNAMFYLFGLERPLSQNGREICLKYGAKAVSIDGWGPVEIVGRPPALIKALDNIEHAITTLQIGYTSSAVPFQLATLFDLPAIRTAQVHLHPTSPPDRQLDCLRTALQSTRDSRQFRELAVISHCPCPPALLATFVSEVDLRTIKLVSFVWRRNALDTASSFTQVQTIEAFCTGDEQFSSLRTAMAEKGVDVSSTMVC